MVLKAEEQNDGDNSNLPLNSLVHLHQEIMRPRFKSDGDTSTTTQSPGRILEECLRIRPEMCASTWCLLSCSTRNMELGSGSMTVAWTCITFSFAIS